MPDADAILRRMVADTESDWPVRLTAAIAKGSKLTGRERQVVDACSRGLTEPMVADVLGVSRWTVHHHMKNARFKLRAKNTTHACCIAIRAGLI